MTFTCPQCSATSANPTDIAEGYCGVCHDWTAPRGVTTDNIEAMARIREGMAKMLTSVQVSDTIEAWDQWHRSMELLTTSPGETQESFEEVRAAILRLGESC